jgi:hypothetical protein
MDLLILNPSVWNSRSRSSESVQASLHTLSVVVLAHSLLHVYHMITVLMLSNSAKQNNIQKLLQGQKKI